MINIKIRMPSAADLMKAAMQEIEQQISKKAKAAAAHHGGVTVRVLKKPDGSIRSVEFQGSEAAIKAAQEAIAS